MALLDQYTLARDPSFLQRAEVALVAAALAIYNEARDPTKPQRYALVLKVLQAPPKYAIQLAEGIASDPTLTISSTDIDLQNRIAAIWNAYAEA